MTQDQQSPTGPIILANDVAREQYQTTGSVVSFRSSRRTTGETWWRLSRTGPKQGECRVEYLRPVDPQAALVLEVYRPESGFETTGDWQDAIEELHGGLEPGHLYRITRTDEDTSQSGGGADVES